MTPWIMEMLSDTLAEDGLIFTDIQVDALTSWTQFFKNLPVALIAFVLIFSDIFTKELQIRDIAACTDKRFVKI